MTLSLYNQSWILASYEGEKYRNGAKAVNLAEKLSKITQYCHPLALDALATAYAEKGKFSLAVLTAHKVVKLVD